MDRQVGHPGMAGILEMDLRPADGRLSRDYVGQSGDLECGLEERRPDHVRRLLHIAGMPAGDRTARSVAMPGAAMLSKVASLRQRSGLSIR